MKEFRYLKNVTTLELRRPEDCAGCGRCVEVCPHQVFELVGKQVRIVDRDACMECGACPRNCPVTVITVDAGVGCAAGLIAEWLNERNVKGLSGACCSRSHPESALGSGPFRSLMPEDVGEAKVRHTGPGRPPTGFPAEAFPAERDHNHVIAQGLPSAPFP